MPRTARLDAPGVLHHVMIRGIGRSNFADSVISQSGEQYLLCFWAARELGMSHTELAKKLEMSLSNIGFSVERGESIAKRDTYSLEK